MPINDLNRPTMTDSFVSNPQQEGDLETPHVRSKNKKVELVVRDNQESISAKSLSLRMPSSESNDESEDCQENKAEIEGAKTKTEFLTVPDKVTHNTVSRT